MGITVAGAFTSWTPHQQPRNTDKAVTFNNASDYRANRLLS